MISKANAKFLKSLQIKKFRKEQSCFLVEGEKSVNELLRTTYKVKAVYGTLRYKENNRNLLSDIEVVECTEEELSKVSSLKSNNSALAVVSIPETVFSLPLNDEFFLVLDKVNDPGNLGTIIRVADWYGIKKIYCSLDTVDLYNPKVITSTKGSFSRVEVIYCDLLNFLNKYSGNIYGTFLDGENIHDLNAGKLKGGGVVMGNEANGISDEVGEFVTKKITIPSYGETESLNVSIATAIVCDNLKRLSR